MKNKNTLLYDFTKSVLMGTDAYNSAKDYALHLSQDKSEYTLQSFTIHNPNANI